jgi:ABC-2 type transport system permease protein
VTFAHLRTVMWLRWRLMVNQFSRMSLVTRLVSWTFFVGASIFAFSSFIGAWSTAAIFLPDELPQWLVYLWDGLIVIYLLSHMAGLINELQQSETLSLGKFLHLPVSPRGVFLLNYFNSTFNLSLATFLPMMLGVSFAQIGRYGWQMAALIPLILAFFFMITAITHQFKGWLAALMQDKRRKRTLMAVGTLVIVLIALTPAVLDRTFIERKSSGSRFRRDSAELEMKLAAKQISEAEFAEQKEKLVVQRQRNRSERLKSLERWGQVANHVIPVGWLARGAEGIARRELAVPLLCFLGMTLIGSFSLSRSFGTAISSYRGVNSGKSRAARTAPAVLSTGSGATGALPDNWLSRSFPLLSEHQSAIAMASLRSLSRAPEAKLAIIFPLVALAIIGGSSVLREKFGVEVRALTGVGICFFVMMGITQLIQNQFGFDREGFRFYMLAPLKERDILIGKNAALAPLAFGMAATALVVIQVISPLEWSHFAATFFQLGTMFLVTSLVGNLMSIVVPMAMKSGSLKPVNLKMGGAILQILIFLLAPLGIMPALAPLGIEILVERYYGQQWPIYLIGASGYFLLMIPMYWWIVSKEGELLAERKQKIMEAIKQHGN